MIASLSSVKKQLKKILFTPYLRTAQNPCSKKLFPPGSLSIVL